MYTNPMDSITIQIPALNGSSPKKFMEHGKELLPSIEKLLPISKYHTKTATTIIAMIAENNKHTSNSPINIKINANELRILITATDEGPGFKHDILKSTQEKFSTETGSLGKGLISLIRMIISCRGEILIQNNKTNNGYCFKESSVLTGVQLDSRISAIKTFANTNTNGTLIKIMIPTQSLRKDTSSINLDSYVQW